MAIFVKCDEESMASLWQAACRVDGRVFGRLALPTIVELSSQFGGEASDVKAAGAGIGTSHILIV